METAERSRRRAAERSGGDGGARGGTTPHRRVNVLQHCLGSFKDRLDPDPRTPLAAHVGVVGAGVSSLACASVECGRLLRIDRIPHALPAQLVGWLAPVGREVRFGPRLFVHGDHRDMGSLHGALCAGRRAAAAVAEALGVASARRAAS